MRAMERHRNEGAVEMEDTEKSRRTMTSSGTIPTGENPVTSPGIEPVIIVSARSGVWECGRLGLVRAARWPLFRFWRGHRFTSLERYSLSTGVDRSLVKDIGHLDDYQRTRFSHVGIVPEMPLLGGFSQGSPVSLAVAFRRCSILAPITLISSQHHIVKRRPNLFTPSFGRINTRTDTLCMAFYVGKDLDGPVGDVGAGAKEAGNCGNGVLGTSAEKFDGSIENFEGITAEEFDGTVPSVDDPAALVAVNAGSDVGVTDEEVDGTIPI
ncbi:hypothetical protein PR048_009249 [Dryococelus australis]|uniref:Uncharacterized protein n=1 Tax=Dryococelus australis TaxID=614101 RepID=A0ABQ9I177_9NEOP|nr:hypothetical protein PR048_009249 [Dryococelus australis]